MLVSFGHVLGQNSHYRAERRKEGLRQIVEIISFFYKVWIGIA